MTPRYVLRPCWVVGLVWLLTLLLCPWMPDVWRVAVMVGCALVAVASLAIPFVRRVHAIPVVSIACLAAVALFQFAYYRQITAIQPQLNTPISLSVQVVDGDLPMVLEVTDGALPRGTRLAYYPTDPEQALEPYDTFQATFTVAAYREEGLSECVRRASGTQLQVVTVDSDQLVNTLHKGEPPFSYHFLVLKNRLVTAVRSQLDGDVAAVVSGICYGMDDDMSIDAKAIFRTCGVSHLFAVSGLHMSVLVFGLLTLLRRFRVSRVWRSVAGLLFLLIFASTVGWTASVVRSGVMCATMLLCHLSRREADARSSMGLALILLLGIDPFAAYDVGLLLSFSATYGLVCWSRPLHTAITFGWTPPRFVRLYRFVTETVAVGLSALLATLPVTALFFGRISLLSIPANLCTTLPAELVLIMCSFAAPLEMIGLSVVATPTFWVAGILARYLLAVCRIFSSFSFATVAIRAPFLLLWVVGTAIILCLGWRLHGRVGRALLCGVCVCTVCGAVLLNRSLTRDALYVYASAQTEDTAVVMTRNASTVLVIAPTRSSSPFAAQTLLQRARVSQVDVLCVLGGEEPAVSYIPLALGEYVSDRTVVLYCDLPCDQPMAGISLDTYCVTAGEITAYKREDCLELLWDGEAYAFYPKRITEPSTRYNAVFSVGDQIAAVELTGAMQWIDCGSSALVYRDDTWYIRGR